MGLFSLMEIKYSVSGFMSNLNSLSFMPSPRLCAPFVCVFTLNFIAKTRLVFDLLTQLLVSCSLVGHAFAVPGSTFLGF